MIVITRTIGITILASILKPINKTPADKIGMKAKTAKSPSFIIFTFSRFYISVTNFLLLAFLKDTYLNFLRLFVLAH